MGDYERSKNLSGNDSAVLSALFDPESSLSNAVRIDNSVSETRKANRIASIQQKERDALRLVNQESPHRCEIETAISKLGEIIETDPEYAPAWNNRAQARRMLLKDDELPIHPEEVLGISQDLRTAISIATPRSPNDAVSSLHAKVLASAHSHRGYLLLLASKSDESRKMLELVPGLNSLGKEDLEEMASRELGIGGRYGNDLARQLAVKTNPYAKLCGSIVKEALQKEMADNYRIHPAVIRD